MTTTLPSTTNVKQPSSNNPLPSVMDDPETSDPSLLRKHSTIASFTTSRFTYPSVRVFYRSHEHEDQLPSDPPLPLLVFLHGLGGSVAQFYPLLTRLTGCSSCLAVDLPGCGRSAFAPSDSWEAYSTEALVELLAVVVARYTQDRPAGQSIVLVGHSMGCSLAVLLAHQLAAAGETPAIGLVAICPVSELADPRRLAIIKALLWIPTPLFDLWRAWDARGGIHSTSVTRFVGAHADDETRHMQLRFNRQSRTPVWRRIAWGGLPRRIVEGQPEGGLPGKEGWASLDLPVCLIAGESDDVTPPREVRKIVSFLEGPRPTGQQAQKQKQKQKQAQKQKQKQKHSVADITQADFAKDTSSSPTHLDVPSDNDEDNIPSTPGGASDDLGDLEPPPPLPGHPPRYVEMHVLPAPANHGLLYLPSTVAVLSGLVGNFLSQHVTGRLDRGWQLRYLSREGKWDVKNLEKWSKVQPVSAPIAGIFRAMKTLRQVDEVHSPARFVAQWSSTIRDVIDISHDHPVYDPADLEAGGIRYHKIPTVSKIPPTDSEVAAFIALVDRIRAERSAELKGEQSGSGSGSDGSDGKDGSDENTNKDTPFVGVHCHYGFNRTGFFIVCYLVERCGYTVSKAIKTFAEARPVGIRHAHFLDALSLKYANVADG